MWKRGREAEEDDDEESDNDGKNMSEGEECTCLIIDNVEYVIIRDILDWTLTVSCHLLLFALFHARVKAYNCAYERRGRALDDPKGDSFFDTELGIQGEGGWLGGKA